MFILDISQNYNQVLRQAADLISAGSLVIFPSDTVYILAVDPTNQKAVDTLLSFKDRWVGKAISVAVSDVDMAKDYVQLSADTKNLYQNLFPGPFTIVSPGLHRLATGIEAENGTLGIRIPDSKYIHDLIKLLGKPITATSANLSGRTPNYSVATFLHPLSLKKKNLISLIVDAGKLPRNKPSTVIDAVGGEIKILRRGDLITSSSETLISKSESETGKIAQFLLDKAKRLGQNKPLIFSLSGDLGCGKTVFSRSVGKKLGITQKILSPTFVIYNQYPLSSSVYKTFYHFDLYRLDRESDFEEISFLKHFLPGTISCIEWPENMGKNLFQKIKKNSHLIAVNFTYLDPSTRQISFS
ncbi:MAG: Sua5/YciO/YrdC family protein [Candidatus Shapirobacteria bacterium GW2011_GWE1_38_10]|uniref:L-threonylcarbamoyladenylate synthase n=1 Tax=Candidatus Shapirobacteria bacterium GW2011_GWE1_38_10 TaxID=1618488 RepID=A0A0G0LB57_9BACT|nr:MAG: Sua5/YciO/YrdC family protein [Candidatus Shapirobacteria bacterium GW2011_GWF2_37_20]KKQ49916.1 MAG: Sua5/YciO/YrdC family protein [Candidatus Shapirobacteria bacterium GW2011_GWE1_38_10]